MKRWAIILALALGIVGSLPVLMPAAVLPIVAAPLALALGKDTCEVPDYLVHADGKLPRVAIMAKEHALNVLVVGTGSSMLGGQAGASSAYPARLEEALKAKLPGTAVTVKTDVKSRRTTAEMARGLGTLPTDPEPGLVIWQTGTVDAMRGTDPDDFRFVLEKGVRKLLTAGVDVVLMNMQYSPRTEAMIAAGPYSDAMRLVAQQTDVPLFDRAAAMKYWSEAGVFDFSGADGTKVAERVHDCLGKVLADMILESAGLERPKTKDNP